MRNKTLSLSGSGLMSFPKVLAIALLLLLAVHSVRAEVKSDVRVLIDISGSMKQNDPKNLRAPALKLLVGLLPDGTRAGVWTFGQYVNMQVQLDKVDERWRNVARQEADRIHSRGLYTNIEEAIKRATVDWKQRDPNSRRSLILLTDGMVDISKDPKVSAASRKRLMEEILPRLHESDVTINTIALSKNADAELLKTLSLATDGRYAEAVSADMLERTFLHMFEKSVAADAVPLKDNKFSVDKSVSDFTLLVFHGENGKDSKVSSPSGKSWGFAQHPKNVKWAHEMNYDLITVKKPEAGEWRLESKLDPDNRVMVVTNLRLKVDKLPNNILLGEEDLQVRARLTEDGKTISRKEVRDVTRFSLSLSQSGKETNHDELRDNGVDADQLAGDGVYSGVVRKFSHPGKYDLVVRAESPTFSRELHHTVSIIGSPVKVQIEELKDKHMYRLKVMPSPGMLRPESISMQLMDPEGHSKIIPQMDADTWSSELPATLGGKRVTVTVVGTRFNGVQFKMDFNQELRKMDPPQEMISALEEKAIKQEHAATISPEKATPTPPVAAPAEAGDESAPLAAKTGVNAETKPTESAQAEADKGLFGSKAIRLTVFTLVANLVLFGIGIPLYLMMRKRRAKKIAAEQADLKV